MSEHQFIGIGIDTEEIDRFKKINPTKNKSFLKKIYTARELKYCFSRIPPAPYLAVHFSGKEAVYKALSSVLGKKKLAYNEIEILHQKSGRPTAKIKNNKFGISISLSHSRSIAAAVALIWRIK